jgi:hypothetical protein
MDEKTFHESIQGLIEDRERTNTAFIKVFADAEEKVVATERKKLNKEKSIDEITAEYLAKREELLKKLNVISQTLINTVEQNNEVIESLEKMKIKGGN